MFDSLGARSPQAPKISTKESSKAMMSVSEEADDDDDDGDDEDLRRGPRELILTHSTKETPSMLGTQRGAMKGRA